MMRRCKPNKYTRIGSLAIIIFFVTKDFIPDFLKGILLGLGIFGYLLGIYSENHDISKLQEWKKSLLGRGE